MEIYSLCFNSRILLGAVAMQLASYFTAHRKVIMYKGVLVWSRMEVLSIKIFTIRLEAVDTIFPQFFSSEKMALKNNLTRLHGRAEFECL